MKKRFIILATCLALSICTVTGCKHEKSMIPVLPGPPAGPSTGKWVSGFFNHDGDSSGNHLDGYTFDFEDGGIMTVDNNIDLMSGNWTTGINNGTAQFGMTIQNPDPLLSELNGNWLISANTSANFNLSRLRFGRVSSIRLIRK